MVVQTFNPSTLEVLKMRLLWSTQCFQDSQGYMVRPWLKTLNKKMNLRKVSAYSFASAISCSHFQVILLPVFQPYYTLLCNHGSYTPIYYLQNFGRKISINFSQQLGSKYFWCLEAYKWIPMECSPNLIPAFLSIGSAPHSTKQGLQF